MKKGLLRLDLREKFANGRSKNERLKAHLIDEMVAGRIKPGEALPSESQFAELLGVTRVTVRQAMASLEGEGLVRRIQGKGNFVEADARTKLKRGLDLFALVVPQTSVGFYPSLLKGFEAAAGDVHHQAMVCSTDNEVSRQAEIVLQLMDQQVGGVAIVPAGRSVTPAYQIRQLQERGIPVVFCHRRVGGVAVPLLAVPFHGEGYLSGKTLAEHGHRRVVFISYSPQPEMNYVERGFQEGLRVGGCDVSAEVVYTGGDSVSLKEENVWATLQRVFDRPDPPTAIFATFDPLAEMIYLLVPRLGLRVPEDVSLIGFGGALREGAVIKRLTSVVIDETALGRQAASMLYEMRSGKRPIEDNEEIVMPVTLSEGTTLAQAGSEKESAA